MSLRTSGGPISSTSSLHQCSLHRRRELQRDRTAAHSTNHRRLVTNADDQVRCSPALSDSTGTPKDAYALARMPLIHDLTMPHAGVFPSWRQWLQQQGVRLPTREGPGLRINTSAAVVQAALNGQGVALARRAFVSDELRAGRLVRVLPSVRWPIRWAHDVVASEAVVAREPVQLFAEWLVREAEADLHTPGPGVESRPTVVSEQIV